VNQSSRGSAKRPAVSLPLDSFLYPVPCMALGSSSSAQYFLWGRSSNGFFRGLGCNEGSRGGEGGSGG
jgi:hypothetical protein